MAMRMPKFDKKTWCHIGAGTVAVILLSIAVVQCSDKEDARNHYAAAADLVRDLTVEKDSLGRRVNELSQDVNRRRTIIATQEQDNSRLRDSVYVLEDSIAVLNDSIAHLNTDLNDCRGSKRRPTAPNKNTPNKKTPVKKKPVNPAPAPVAKRDTVIIVRDVSTTTPAQTSATPVHDGNSGVIINGNGQNNGTININNGTINNYNQLVDTVRRAKTTIHIKIKRSRAIYEY